MGTKAAELHVGQRRKWTGRSKNRAFRIVAITEFGEVWYCYDGEEPSRGWRGWNVDQAWMLNHSEVAK